MTGTPAEASARRDTCPLTGRTHPTPSSQGFCTNCEPHVALWAFQSMPPAQEFLDIRGWFLCRPRKQKSLRSAGNMGHSLGTRDPIHGSRSTGDFHANYALLRNELWAPRQPCLPGHRLRHTKRFTLFQRASGTMQIRPARLTSVLCHPADPSEAQEAVQTRGIPPFVVEEPNFSLIHSTQ